MDINPLTFMGRKVMRENELKDARSFLIKMHRIVDRIVKTLIPFVIYKFIYDIPMCEMCDILPNIQIK